MSMEPAESANNAQPPTHTADEPEADAVEVEFADSGKVFKLGPDQSILEVALLHDIPLDHACGGVCACSTCHIYVEQGLDKLVEAEDDELDELDEAPALKLNSRLACQSKLEPGKKHEGRIVVRIPAWNRNAAREGH